MNTISSLRHKIVIFCRDQYPDWVNGARLEKLAMELGYKASNSSRRGRELVRGGILERRLNAKKCVEYRWKKAEPAKAHQEAGHSVLKMGSPAIQQMLHL